MTNADTARHKTAVASQLLTVGVLKERERERERERCVLDKHRHCQTQVGQTLPDTISKVDLIS